MGLFDGVRSVKMTPIFSYRVSIIFSVYLEDPSLGSFFLPNVRSGVSDSDLRSLDS